MVHLQRARDASPVPATLPGLTALKGPRRIVVGLAFLSGVFAASSAPAQSFYVMTSGNSLLRFNGGSPGSILSTLPVTGLQGGEALVAMDFRTATGALYAIGSTSRVYTINTSSGVATQVGSSAFSPALSGTAFGADFSPVVNLIRIVSDSDQNLRIDPDAGTVTATDSTLAYASGDSNAAADPNIVAAAYTQNFPGATSTSLYVIDSGLDVLAIQGFVGGSPVSPNSGQLFTIGALGADTSDSVGFDVTAAGIAYASLTVGGAPQLYTISLSTGAAQLAGTIGDGATPIRALAVAPAGTLHFSSATYSAGENEAVATITVNRTAGSAGTVTVDYATSTNTAAPGSDYTETAGFLSFAEGETSTTFQVPILDDSTNESDERINLTLSDAAGGALLGSPTTALLTIVDNESTPEVTIANATVTEGNSGSVNAVFTVSLSGATSATVTVDFTTVDGTAAGGADYAATTGTLVFGPGETQKSVVVGVLGDANGEDTETFIVVLSDAVNAIIASGGGTGVILDDDLGNDADGDGTTDQIDGCPNDPNKTSPGDCGCGAADIDSDGDGVADCIDDCPTQPNEDQADADRDGTGDVCDNQTSSGCGSGACGAGLLFGLPLMMLGWGRMKWTGPRRLAR